MCPNCPRCNSNNFGLGCQDRFGSNMRPGGGVLGGAPAVGGGTEHQGYGTPHLHVEVHIASAYQFDTLVEIVEKLRNGSFALKDLTQFHEWLHAEDIVDEKVRAHFDQDLEEQWHARFSGTQHHDMSSIPTYLVAESKLNAIENVCTVSSSEKQDALRDDGNSCAACGGRP